MRRRHFITLLASAGLTWPRSLVAQGTDRARRIGVLSELAADDPQALSNAAALQRGLQKLGWSDYRWASDDPVLVWKYAKELVEVATQSYCRALQSGGCNSARGDPRHPDCIHLHF